MKKIILTGPQMMVVLAIKLGKKKIYLEWSRGSGKSTILGYILNELVKQMPRACFTLVGETYMQILSVTLKSAKQGLEMFGVYEDIDYVVGQSGKKFGFAMPIERPDKWNNIIHFSNGAIVQLVSLDQKNGGRGLNSYAEIGDEAALLDPERLFVNVSIANRAGRKRFPNASLRNAEIYMSSTPLTKRGKWFTDMERIAKQKPDEYAYVIANAYSNAHNLPADYFETMRNKAPSKMYYRAEILNIRPKEIEQGFYAQLKAERHYYRDYRKDDGVIDMKADTSKKYHFDCRYDNDLNRDEPIIMSLDFGVFNSATIHQREGMEHRILKEFYVENPKILKDLIEDKFGPYYKHHRNKRVNLHYGHDGNNKQANSKKTLAQEVEGYLKAIGWKVTLKSKGAAPTHLEKYLVLNTILREESPQIPRIRINEYNCPNTIISMENAAVKDGGTTGLHKDKSSERSSIVKQQHATHLSDTVDIPLYDLYRDDALASRSRKEYMPISIGK